jgi:hypothetical protein
MNNLRLVRNDKGQVLVLTALLLPVLIVFIGFAVDGGLVWELKRRMQTAADGAALAGAVAKRSGGDPTAIENAGRADAATNRFPHGTSNITVTINTPPTTGPYAGNSGYVEAVVSQVAEIHFIRLLSLLIGGNHSTATVVARAVAGLEGQNCIYAMNPTAHDSLALNGTPDLNAPDCGAYVGSSQSDAMHLEGQASLNLASINIVGDYECQGESCNNISPEPNTGAGTQTDPLASLQAPTPVGGCLASPLSGSGPAILSPGRYCNGIKIEGIPSAHFLPGTYYIEDNDNNGTGFWITSTPVVTGTDVTFYIAAGQIKIDGGANVNFTAPTTGTYDGILFFQSRTNTTEVILTGGTQMQLNGAIYAIGADMRYSGGNCSTSPPKTLLVADEIEFVGQSCIARPDDLPPSAGQLVLAE